MAKPFMRSVTWLDKAGIKAAVKEASISALEKTAIDVQTTAKKSMKGGGKKVMGRDSRGKFTKAVDIEHVPSEPGTPPNKQFGHLMASINVAKTWTFSFVVGPTKQVEYGAVHEFGGKHHPPRPYMRPALEQVNAGGKYKVHFATANLMATRAGKATHIRNKKKVKS